jgi:hypothetical protein
VFFFSFRTKRYDFLIEIEGQIDHFFDVRFARDGSEEINLSFFSIREPKIKMKTTQTNLLLILLFFILLNFNQLIIISFIFPLLSLKLPFILKKEGIDQ